MTLFDLSNWVPRHQGGLVALTRELLVRRLDKVLQTSDWSAQPLSAAQMEYTASDATVLLDLLGSLLPEGDGPLVLRAWKVQEAQGRVSTEARAGAGTKKKTIEGRRKAPENNTAAM